MNEFVAIVTSFPTVFFSVALIVVCLFWVLAVIGVVDVDMMDLDFDIDAETDASGVGPLAGLLLKFGLNGVPITIVISVLVLLSWLFCYFGSAYLIAFLPSDILKLVGGVLLIGACLVVAFPITALSLRPTRDLFRGESALLNRELVGHACKVRTLEVTTTFGQGEVNVGGAEIIIDIRATEPNTISKGDLVAITGHDPTSRTYSVIPETEFMSL